MISKNNVLKETLFNPFGKFELNNLYSHHAESAYKQMKYIAEHKDFFCSRNFSDLVNVFEIMYKGIIEEYINLYPEYRPNEAIMSSHRLEELAQEINKTICPVVKNQENLYHFLDKLSNYSDGYTRSRYKEFYEFSDYLKLWTTYERQREFLYKSIDKLKEDKNNMKIIEEEYDDY